MPTRMIIPTHGPGLKDCDLKIKDRNLGWKVFQDHNGPDHIEVRKLQG